MSANCKGLLQCYIAAAGLISSVVLADQTNDVKTGVTNIATATVKSAPENPAEIFARAEEAMGKVDVKNSLELAVKAAELNHVPAQVFLGEYFDYAEYNEMAVGWFMTAAFQGNVGGAFGLAKMYAAGEGVEQSNEKALYWFRFAAEKNHYGAVTMMFSVYNKGLIGQAVDIEQAKYWGDKMPALEAERKKETMRKKQIVAKKKAELEEKRKIAQEAADEAFLKAKKLDEAAKETEDEVSAGRVESGAAK